MSEITAPEAAHQALVVVACKAADCYPIHQKVLLAILGSVILTMVAVFDLE